MCLEGSSKLLVGRKDTMIASRGVPESMLAVLSWRGCCYSKRIDLMCVCDEGMLYDKIMN